MGCQVYANGNSIACKAADGKTTAAMPDVCLSPPSPPAGPIPIPYPNTGMASDTTDGSKTVQINGEEVMLKDKSVFKQSTGDEAATKSLGMGVVTHQIQGKVNFVGWSMDVKFEGENVPRHLDLTGHNEASKPPNTPPWPYMDAMAMSKDPCAKEKAKEQNACGDLDEDQQCKSAKCQKARKCKLSEYGASRSPNCCKPQVAHHILPNSLLQGVRGDSATNVPGLNQTGSNAYTMENAPCVCCSGKKGVSNPIGTHKKMHDLTKKMLQSTLMAGEELTYPDARSAVAQAHRKTFKGADGRPLCKSGCIQAQIDNHMQRTGDGSPQVLQKDGATTKNYDRFKKNRGDL